MPLSELAEALRQRPAAILAGAGVSIAFSGHPIDWRRFLAEGLDLARKAKVISKEQHQRYLEALKSGDSTEAVTVGEFLEKKLRRDRPEAFAAWLQETLGKLEVRNPELGRLFLDARRQGLLLATNNFDALLSQVTGLPSASWKDPAFAAGLRGDPARADLIFHLDGSWRDPDSIVFGSGTAGSPHRLQNDAFVAPLRFILFVGVGSGFFTTGIIESLKLRRDSLPGAILCREQDVPFFREQLAGTLPWIRPAPYAGDFDALPKALANVLDGSPRPETPPESGAPAEPATRRPRVLFQLSGSEINEVAFVPGSSQTLVAGLADGTFRILDTSLDAEIRETSRELMPHKGNVWSIDLSPDGRQIASSGADGQVLISDFTTRLGENRVLRHLATVWCVAYRPDGRSLATACEDGRLRLYRTSQSSTDLSPFLTLASRDTGGILAVAFSPDGRLCASAGEGAHLDLWDLASQQALRRFTTGENWTGSLAFSPDGVLLVSAGADGPVTVWNVQTGQVVHRLTGHTNWVQSVDFSPDGRLIASASWDKTVRVWDVGAGREIACFTGHTDRLWSAKFSPDGAWIASGSSDGTVRLWPTPEPGALPLTRPLPEDFLKLVESPPRFASFLARLVLEDREAMELVETLDPARLLGALRQAATTVGTLRKDGSTPNPFPEAPDPQRILDLESRLSTGFQPPPLWLAWMEHCRGAQLRTLAERLKDMVRQPASPAAPAP